MHVEFIKRVGGMRVVIVEDAAAVAEVAADWIERQLRSKPASVLGLATGSTPTATYQRLIGRLSQNPCDLTKLLTFNLDEYVGLPTSDPNSYRSFMDQNLFDHLPIDKAQTFLPNGNADDLLQECQSYEARIVKAGGIDLQLLGIGRDGHIGFNEPGSSLAGRTTVQLLAKQTILDNARFFGSEDLVPKCAITMGVGTILEAKKILLIATGSAKAEAIRATIEGPMTAMVTASALQFHPNATILLDSAASHLLENREYYIESERLRSTLGTGAFVRGCAG